MSEQLAYTLLAACFGFVAAVFFCIGAALLSHKKMVTLATPFWDHNEVHATAIVSQSVQYAPGGLLLVVSFVLQVVAVLASPTNPLSLHPVLANACTFVLATLLLLGLLSFPRRSICKESAGNL
jgi:hypothetical protein